MSVLMSKDKKELIVTCDCKCGQSFSIYIDDDWKDMDYYAFLCSDLDFETLKTEEQLEQLEREGKLVKVELPVEDDNDTDTRRIIYITHHAYNRLLQYQFLEEALEVSSAGRLKGRYSLKFRDDILVPLSIKNTYFEIKVWE